MPLRVLHLFPLLNTAESNFATTSTLQIVVSRAWSRRAIAHAQPKIPAQDVHGTTRGKKKSTTSGSSILKAGSSRMTGATSIACNAPQIVQVDTNHTALLTSNQKATVLRGKQKPKQRPVIDLKHIDCEDAERARTVPGFSYYDPVLNNYEPTHTDLFFEETPLIDCLKNIPSKDLSSYLTTVNIDALPPTSLPALPIPTSVRTLYHNLVHILRTRKPRPTLAALVDYHLLFPEHHSTRLFRAMEERFIQENIETYRLRVRWLIYQGFWDRAWSYARQLMNKYPGGTIPFPIWLEFCHTRKGPKIVEGTVNPKKKFIRNPSEPMLLSSVRRQIMNTNRPTSIPALKDTPPAAFRNIVQLMVKAKLRHQALKLTEDYFKALPLEMTERMNHRCLDIVKIHLVCNGTGKTGLPRFNAAKTLLFSLLSSNPSLRPTSDTLMFILSTLQKAKRCGTVAWNFISLCKEKWGPELEDRRVQRRVSKWALKEGRMDIVATILRAETIERRSRRRRLLELKVVGDLIRPRAKFLHRPSVRRIYPRNGIEAQLWRRLRIRVHRKLFKHIAKGRKFTKAPRRPASQPALDPTKSTS